MVSKQGVDFSTIKTWQEGLNELDINKVKAALDAGVAPDTYVDGKHPLHILLNSTGAAENGEMNMRSLLLHNARGRSDNKSFDKKQAVIDLLVASGLSLLASTKGTDESVIDTVLLDNDAIIVSKLVLAALKQSAAVTEGPLYQLDFDKLIEKASPEDNAEVLEIDARKQQLQKQFDKLEEIHGYVRIVLSSPSSSEDRAFVQKHHAQLSFWLNEFKAPDQNHIDSIFPVDEEEARKAREQMRRNRPFSLFGFGGGASEQDDKIITLKKENPEDILEELNQYTGIESFKKNMYALMLRVRFDQARLANGLTTDVQNYHTAFLGNPGTGKTTCSRLKARLLYSLGMTGPRYAEVSRDSIISKYHGNTESKVKELIDSVDTLFIDEAYSLTDGSGNRHDYGQRALDTIVAALGNRKDAFTLFVAGYKEPMERFITANEGMRSRIKVFEEMRDFTMPELKVILENNIDVQGYIMSESVNHLVGQGIHTEKEKLGRSNFGNARVIVDLVQDLPNHMAYRLGQQNGGLFDQFDAAALSRITEDDVVRAFNVRGIDLQKNVVKQTDAVLPDVNAKHELA